MTAPARISPLRPEARRHSHVLDGWEDRQAYLTPAAILDPVRVAMGGRIGLDPCTEPDNPTRAATHYALPANGLALPWTDLGPVWVNPPWGMASAPWVTHCLRLGAAGVSLALLIPADPSTRRGQSVLGGAEAVVFLAGRIAFIPAANRSGPPMIYQRGAIIATWGLPPIEGLGVRMAALPPGGLW